MAANPDAPWEDAPAVGKDAPWESAPVVGAGPKGAAAKPQLADPGFFSAMGTKLAQGFFNDGADELAGVVGRARGGDKGTYLRLPDGSEISAQTGEEMGAAARTQRRQMQEAADQHHGGSGFAARMVGDVGRDVLLKMAGLPTEHPAYQTIMGTVGGWLGSDSENAGDKLQAALLGGGGALASPIAMKQGGKLLGWGAGKASSGARSALKAISDKVEIQPSEAGKRLMAEGIPATLGHLAPNSWAGKLEPVAANATFGSGLARMRADAEEVGIDALLNKARAPGAVELPRGASIQSKVDELGEGFSGAYDNLKGRRLEPEIHMGEGRWRGLKTDESLVGAAKVKGAFELATSNPQLMASDADRLAVTRFLDAEYTRLPKAMGKSGVDASDFHAVRSNIRKKAAALEKAASRGNFSAGEQAKMLRSADGFMTEVMEGQLPDDAVKALRGADSKYGTFRAFEDLADAPGLQKENFTPRNMLKALQKHNSTDEARQLASDMAESFQSYPKTGGQSFIADTAAEYIPKRLQAPMMYALNRYDPLRRFALGKTDWQQALKSGAPISMPGDSLAAALRWGSDRLDESGGSLGAALARALLEAQEGRGARPARSLAEADKDKDGRTARR